VKHHELADSPSDLAARPYRAVPVAFFLATLRDAIVSALVPLGKAPAGVTARRL
jgi:hypothetical protein